MAKTYNRLEIDVNKKPNSIGIRPVQNDTKSRYLDVCLYENGVAINLTGEQVRITFRKADGSTFFNQGEVTDATAGRCQFALTNEILSEAKAVEAQISVWNAGGQILSTQVFEIYVTAAIPWTDSVESENEYGVLVVLFQEIRDALDTMHKIATTFGEPGDKAAEYGVDTFWGILEMLAQRGDVESTMYKYVKGALCSAWGADNLVALDKMLIINALLLDNDGLNKWALRQNGIGNAINNAFDLNSVALAKCDTVIEIAESAEVISTIKDNEKVAILCAKNKILAKKLIEYATDEMVLLLGLGYQKFNVGDIVSLNYNGNPTDFRVVHKNYKTQNKIVLVSEGILDSIAWRKGSPGKNDYQTSSMREYLNSDVLSKFSDEVQDAIITTSVQCHNFQTEVFCNDKIWALSYAEIGLGTASEVPLEGTAMDYFKSAAQRKKVGFDNIWFLRTPNTRLYNRAYYVKGDGSSDYTMVSERGGVVPAFEI